MRTSLRNPESIQLINPWSGAHPPDKCLTWREIVAWCQHNVDDRDQAAWIREARRAVRDNNGEQLGKMIIGS